MSENQSEFLRKLQSTLITAGVSFLIMITLSMTAFYYNTKNAVKHNEESIKQLKEEKADKDVYETTVKSIDKRLNNIEQKLP